MSWEPAQHYLCLKQRAACFPKQILFFGHLPYAGSPKNRRKRESCGVSGEISKGLGRTGQMWFQLTTGSSLTLLAALKHELLLRCHQLLLTYQALVGCRFSLKGEDMQWEVSLQMNELWALTSQHLTQPEMGTLAQLGEARQGTTSSSCDLPLALLRALVFPILSSSFQTRFLQESD